MHIRMLRPVVRLALLVALVLTQTSCTGGNSVRTIDLQSKALMDGDKTNCLAVYEDRVGGFMKDVKLAPPVDILERLTEAIPDEERRAIDAGALALRHARHSREKLSADQIRAIVLEASQREFERLAFCPGTSRKLSMYFFAEAVSVYLYDHAIDADKLFSVDGLPSTATDPGQRLLLALVVGLESDQKQER